jgi:preprotein translocase subunit SecB
MKNTKKDQQITFQIKGIELLDLKLNQPKQPLPLQTTFHFNINLEQRISPENKLVIVVTTIEILHKDKETRLASITGSCTFEISNFDEFNLEGSQEVSFPNNILVTFNSVSISTLRGLMFSQFKGTFLHNAILPIIDPTSLKKNN